MKDLDAQGVPLAGGIGKSRAEVQLLSGEFVCWSGGMGARTAPRLVVPSELDEPNRALCQKFNITPAIGLRGAGVDPEYLYPVLYDWMGMERLISAMRARDWTLEVREVPGLHPYFEVTWRYAYNPTDDSVSIALHQDLPQAVFLAACPAFKITVERT